MPGPLDPVLLRNFAIALFIGALVGVERERRSRSEPWLFAGLRTFMLIAMAGGIGAWLSRELDSLVPFAIAGLGVVALIVVTHVMSARVHEDKGLTTEVAGVVVFLLGGATVWGWAELAVVLAIATTALLALKAVLHSAVDKLGQEDIEAGLKLLFATFIVLPLLPDRAIDPWSAINPYKLWMLVILISGISLVGYVAHRLLGATRGTVLTGVIAGLASSTALTLAFAKRSQDEPPLSPALAAGILLAWTVMFFRVLVEVAVANFDLLPRVLLPVALLGVAGLLPAAWYYRAGGRGGDGAEVELRNPFSLTSAVRFGLFFAAILLIVAVARRYLPDRYLYAVAALAGTTDVDAITLSLARQARQGLDPTIAVRGIVLAALTNTAVKCGMVVWLGVPALRIRVGLATAVLAVAAALGLALASIVPEVPLPPEVEQLVPHPAD